MGRKNILHLINVGVEEAIHEPDRRGFEGVLRWQRHMHLPGAAFVRRCEHTGR